jgi:pimeloyl-ACP methyl ester carboxylesterase
MVTGGARIVLVHGAWHGAWCWQKLVPALEHLGHDALAIDLPGHGDRWDSPAGSIEYRDAVLQSLRSGDVLLGHSMGGFVISLVAEAAPEKLSHLIYLAAVVPVDGKSVFEASTGNEGIQHYTESITIEGRDFTRVPTLAAATEAFYHDCERELAAWAFDQLRPEPIQPLLEKLTVPTYLSADVPFSYISCTKDRALGSDARQEYAWRLGGAIHEIDASHSCFLSEPIVTAETIHRIVTARAPS